MQLKGKRVIFLGDSITEGSAASRKENIYHQHVGRILGLADAINCGVSGTRIARKIEPSADPSCDRDFVRRADELDVDADLVAVFGGTNDFGHGDAPLGEKGDDTVYTFYGACKCLFEKLCKKYGKEKIVVITPMHRFKEENPYGDGSKKEAGAPLKSYVEAILETAKDMKMTTLNLWEDSELNPNIGDNMKYFADGLHPNDMGHELLGKKIADFLMKI